MIRLGTILALALTLALPEARADYLVLSRVAYLRKAPDQASGDKLEEGTYLALLDDGAQQDGWYKVRTEAGKTGFVYRTLGRRWRDGTGPFPDAVVSDGGGSGSGGGTVATGEPLAVIFEDVAQGDAILLDLGDFEVLIDAGTREDWRTGMPNVAAAIDGSLDVLVITHPHWDHYAGAPSLLREIEVDRLVTNGEFRGPPRDPEAMTSWDLLEEAWEDAGLTPEAAVAGTELLSEQGLRITTLASGGRFPDDADGDNINNDSVVLRVEFGGRSILLTGDIEEDAGHWLVDTYCPPVGACSKLSSDVLKVAHHGSAKFDPDLLEQVDPEWAVVSAHYAAKKHHLPRTSALDALVAVGAKVYSTSADGQEPVVLTVDRAGAMSWEAPADDGAFWRKVDETTWVVETHPQGGL